MIRSYNGDDVIYGSSKGTNVIYSSEGNDTIHCGNDASTIYAGAGNDVIYCGRAADIIYYYSDGGGNDTVYNYQSGDQIVMSRIDQYDETTFQNVSLSGNDVIINFTSGEKMTLKDAADQRVSISGYSYDRTPFSYPYSPNLYSYNNTTIRVCLERGIMRTVFQPSMPVP